MPENYHAHASSQRELLHSCVPGILERLKKRVAASKGVRRSSTLSTIASTMPRSTSAASAATSSDLNAGKPIVEGANAKRMSTDGAGEGGSVVLLDIGANDAANSCHLYIAAKSECKNITIGLHDARNSDFVRARKCVKQHFSTLVLPLVPNLATAENFHCHVVGSSRLDLVKLHDDGNHLNLSPRGTEKDSQSAVVCLAGNFFERIVKNNSIDIIVCSSALQFMSVGVTNNYSNVDVRPDTPGSDQLSRDYHTFLKLRAEELKIGGTLHMTIYLHDRARRRTQFHTGTDRTYMRVFNLLNNFLRSAVQKGEVEEARYRKFCLPIGHRSLEQIKFPFDTNMFPDLELIECFVNEQESAVYKNCCDASGKIDAKRYAVEKFKEIMSWLDPLLDNILDLVLMTKFQKRVLQEVEKEPQKWRCDYLTARVVVRKINAVGGAKAGEIREPSGERK